MTYNWYDTRASTWYEGYDPNQGTGKNQGSFVDLSTLTQGTADYTKALDAITNNIIGLFEQKGITAAQAQQSQQFQDLVAQAEAGDTKGAFQGAAAAVTSAHDRGDLWGADVAEGGDAMRGRSFLESGVTETTTISDLYTLGFGRAADAEGLQYWEEQLAGGTSIQDIAKSFAASDEASVRDVYHEQYGRDADQSGLDYWLSQDEAATGISDADNLRNVITYRGEDLNNDGYITSEEQAKSTYNVASETLVRDDLQNILGQVSNEANRANNPFFTDATNADVFRYMDYIDQARGNNIDTTTGERLAGQGNYDSGSDEQVFTNTHIAYRGLTQDALNQGDVDDFGDDATNMGRFGTRAEIKEYMDAHMGGDSDDLRAAQDSGAFVRGNEELRQSDDMREYGQDVFDDVRETVWGTVTDEDVKAATDYVPWEDVKSPKDVNPTTGTTDGSSTNLTASDAEQLIHPDNIDVWKQNSSLWLADPSVPGSESGAGTTPDDWRPTPTTPDLPTNLPVNRTDINYMGGVSSDVQDRSGYARAKRDFDASIQKAYARQAAQGQVGKRLAGASAKGVKMKRSKASRMGTIRGTGQLGREQQTKSLNI